MSTLQVSNIHFESTGNNRLQYTGSNSYNLVGGGVTVAAVNTSVISFPVSLSVNNFVANSSISVGAVLVANSTVVNATHLGGVSAASYQLNSTLSANVVTLTANNTNFVGTVSAANVVSNAQLSSNLANYTTTTALTNNLANYQTSAGLSANVARLSANNTTFVNGKSEANLNVNNALTANNTSFVGTVSAANVVSNAQLSSNLANYQTSAGLSANVATLTANNSTNFGGQPAAFYTNATNINTGTLPYAQIPVNVVNTTAAFTRTGVTTFSANVVLGTSGLSANGGFGTAGQVLHSNGTATYWATDDNSGGTVTSVSSGNGLTGGPISTTGTLSVVAGTGTVVNTTGVHVNATYIGTLSANNATNLGGVAAASYQLNSTLSANVATLTANNATNLGGVAAANYARVDTADSFDGVVTFNANVVMTKALSANGGFGTAGQVLASGGSGNTYWDSNISPIGKQTIWIPAAAMYGRTTNGAAQGSVETATNKIMLRTLDFDTTTQEFAQFAIQMPKGWNEGTLICQFVWSHAATTTNFGVSWGIEAVAFNDDDAADAAFGTSVTVNDTGGTTNDIYISSETNPLTIAGSPGAEEWVVFQVSRRPNFAHDTMAIDARLHGVKLHYTIDNAKDD